MATLQLNVQYFQDSTPAEVPCREENFVVRELDFALPVEQTALVLIDLWNVHHIDSWIERAEAVTKEDDCAAHRAGAGMRPNHRAGAQSRSTGQFPG